MSEQNRDQETPLPPHAELLLEALTRPLTEEEQQQIKAQLAAEPQAAADAALLDTLNAHRTLSHWERRQPDAFAQFARALPRRARHRWLERLQQHMTRHALAYLSVLLVQTTSIAWLLNNNDPSASAYRGLSAANCPSFSVRFAGGVSEAQIRRVLLQVDGRIVNGPDEQGLYAISVGKDKTATARAALTPIAEYIDTGKRECTPQ